MLDKVLQVKFYEDEEFVQYIYIYITLIQSRWGVGVHLDAPQIVRAGGQDQYIKPGTLWAWTQSER